MNPTEPFPPEGQNWSRDYPQNWRKLILARKAFYGIMLCLLACWALSRLTGNETLTKLSGFFPVLLFFIWMPLGIAISHWKCPRCLQRFSGAGFCESCRLALQPGLGRAFLGYAGSLFGRFLRDLEVNPSEDPPDNRYVTDYCSHCRLPRY